MWRDVVLADEQEVMSRAFVAECCSHRQERDKVRWLPGQEASLAPPCSNLRFLQSKCTVLKKVLVILWTFSAPPQSFRSRQ